MDFGQAADLMRGMAMRVEDHAQSGLLDSLDFALERARFYSSGNTSISTQAAMDHPYARRHGRPLLTPHVINRHRGTFFQAWRVVHSQTGGQIVNDSAVADWLEQGTDTMFSRGVGRRVEDDLRPVAKKSVENAVRDMEKGLNALR